METCTRARYAPIRVLGSGTFGTVIEATDRVLGRRVAIKLLCGRRDLEHARLLREARALAAVQHPSVVEIFGVGQAHDGEVDASIDALPADVDPSGAYIVLELVAGQTLTSWQAAPERSREAIIATYLAAGQGLAAAHARGVVHRDFKPGNVMVDEGGRARVVDFGLACGERPGLGLPPTLPGVPLEDESPLVQTHPLPSPYDAVAATLTRSGECWGTRAYMAPEQMIGSRVDARADQFAFCVALWEALTGERPFPSDGAEARVRAIVAGPPEVDATDIGPRLWVVLARGLSPDPMRRFDTMDALLDAVRRATRPRRWVRPLARATMTALTGLALGVVASGWLTAFG